MYYHDGASPPAEIIEKWLAVVHSTFATANAKDNNRPCIAVHCVAGLGRWQNVELHNSSILYSINYVDKLSVEPLFLSP